MNFSHYSDQVLALAVGLVNTWDTGPHGGELLREPSDLESVLDGFGVERRLAVTRADVEGARALRDRLRPVFAATDVATAAALLNELVAEADVTPQLTDHDGVWHLHYAPADASLTRALQATCGMGLMALLAAEGSASRLKVCEADDCADVLVDTSRNQSRRYCSDRCCNRENVAAYRARRRSSG